MENNFEVEKNSISTHTENRLQQKKGEKLARRASLLKSKSKSKNVRKPSNWLGIVLKFDALRRPIKNCLNHAKTQETLLLKKISMMWVRLLRCLCDLGYSTI
jgi:hypothetical protein